MTFFFCSPHPRRHRLPHFPRRSVLRALQHHDGAHYSQRQRVPPSAWRDLLLLALLGGLDCTATTGLEQIRARGSRHHLLGGLEDADAEQHLLHRLPVHLLPGPAVLRHPVLVQQAAAHHQTGGTRRHASSVCEPEKKLRYDSRYKVYLLLLQMCTPLSEVLTKPLYQKS